MKDFLTGVIITCIFIFLFIASKVGGKNEAVDLIKNVYNGKVVIRHYDTVVVVVDRPVPQVVVEKENIDINYDEAEIDDEAEDYY